MEKQTIQQTVAQLIRFSKDNWALVTYGKHTSVNREIGLKIKNQYGMKPTPVGYKGNVPMSLFEVQN